MYRDKHLTLKSKHCYNGLSVPVTFLCFRLYNIMPPKMKITKIRASNGTTMATTLVPWDTETDD